MSEINLASDREMKQKLLDDFYDLKTSEHVPIMVQCVTWGYAYANVRIDDVLYDREANWEANCSYLKDFYTDVVFAAALSPAFPVFDVLKPPHPKYEITPDGFAFTHAQGNEQEVMMREDEYPLLISDIKRFLIEQMAARRYPILTETPYPENYELMKKAYDAFKFHLGTLSLSNEYITNKYGTPFLYTGVGYAPFDFLCDMLRGFKNGLVDIRRRREEVLEACDVIADFIIKVQLGQTKKGDVILFPLHMPPFLRKKDFEEVFWPSFKRVCDHVIKKGAKCALVLEGDWTPHLESLLAFPDKSVIAVVEKGNIFEIKELYTGHIAVCGGLELDFINNRSKEECVSYVKERIDKCAPGGGFMFTTDKALVYKNDLNLENYRAILDTIRNYK